MFFGSLMVGGVRIVGGLMGGGGFIDSWPMLHHIRGRSRKLNLDRGGGQHIGGTLTHRATASQEGKQRMLALTSA